MIELETPQQPQAPDPHIEEVRIGGLRLMRRF